MARKIRLDVLLVERGLVPTRARAQARILAGDAFVGGERLDKAGDKVAEDAEVVLRGDDNPFVSRGGLKLEGALSRFGLEVAGAVAMDIGASTGGFTDCLLQRGASRVYAVDVGYGQLAWRLRQDARVINLERTNIRHLAVEAVAERVDLIVADCSFISLRQVLPPALGHLRAGGQLVVLVKPQFEVGRGRVGKGGVVRDAALRQETIDGLRTFCEGLGLEVRGGVDATIAGPKGNQEHLLWLYKPASEAASAGAGGSGGLGGEDGVSAVGVDESGGFVEDAADAALGVLKAGVADAGPADGGQPEE